MLSMHRNAQIGHKNEESSGGYEHVYAYSNHREHFAGVCKILVDARHHDAAFLLYCQTHTQTYIYTDIVNPTKTNPNVLQLISHEQTFWAGFCLPYLLLGRVLFAVLAFGQGSVCRT